jgi:tRNA(fMet)-specific endonuclease VapC
VKYVLDTNVVARLLDNDARVAPRFAAVATDSVGVPLVVLAELLFGVEKSARREHNRARLQRFAAGVRVLPFDVAVAARYAAVRAEMERKGRSKTDFDLVIACTVLEHGATLITNDAALTDGAIETLVVEDWLGATERDRTGTSRRRARPRFKADCRKHRASGRLRSVPDLPHAGGRSQQRNDARRPARDDEADGVQFVATLLGGYQHRPQVRLGPPRRYAKKDGRKRPAFL